MNKEKKNYGVFAIVAILLIAAIIVSTKMNNTPKANAPENSDTLENGENEIDVSTIGQNINYFDAFRTDRDNLRANEIEYLEEIIADPNTDAETLQDAQQRKLDIVNNMEKEFVVENQIIAKGFADAAVTLRTGSVNVVVDAQELTEEQVAQILELVQRETEEKASNIKVSAKR